MKKIYYGLTRKKQLLEMMVDVCSTLKGNKEDLKSTLILMLATCYQETNMGTFKDKTRYKYGTGLMQFDNMPYKDSKLRGSRFYKVCLKEFNVDISKMKYIELELSPLASIVMARIKYKLVPHNIPSWKQFDEVWGYYKKWYNSTLGKATIEEFKISYKKGLEAYEEIIKEKIIEEKRYRYAKCCANCDYRSDFSTGQTNNYKNICKNQNNKIVFSDMVCNDFDNKYIK